MRLALLVLAITTAVAGCNATMAKRPNANDDPSGPCFGGLASRTELQPIAHKVPIAGPHLATIEQLADQTAPTPEERTTLSLWAKARAECAERGRAFRAQYAPPGWSTAYEEGQLSVARAIAQLYSGASYAWFNQERQKISAATGSGLNRAADADDATRRQRAIDQQAATLLFLRSIQPPPLPPAVNCTSHQVGNTVQTTCR
jgi:hypothetical protein